MFDNVTGRVLCGAARCNEISAARLTPMVLEVLHALIIKWMLLETRDLTTTDIAKMVDEVLLPIVAA